MKAAFIFVVISLALSACTSPQQIASFEECVLAGNPVMESYPRRCMANGQNFIENISDEPGSSLSPQFIQCEPSAETAVCTMQYDPVCALKDNGIRCVTAPCPSFDAVTEGNSCTPFRMNQSLGYYPGACEDNLFVICKEVVTGFNISEIARQSGWICVDICPNNYDPYVTQIGAEMCILHYGVEEIEGWEICERSSDSCSCVRAYETTISEPVDNAQFRCVPDQYAEKLLFRAGQERIDENGEIGVMIA